MAVMGAILICFIIMAIRYLVHQFIREDGLAFFRQSLSTTPKNFILEPSCMPHPLLLLPILVSMR
jgi:hypothetical protein